MAQSHLLDMSNGSSRSPVAVTGPGPPPAAAPGASARRVRWRSSQPWPDHSGRRPKSGRPERMRLNREPGDFNLAVGRRLLSKGCVCVCARRHKGPSGAFLFTIKGSPPSSPITQGRRRPRRQERDERGMSHARKGPDNNNNNGPPPGHALKEACERWRRLARGWKV